MRRMACVLVAVCVVVACGTAMAKSPRWGGLAAVAVTPDGKTIVTGGDNRTLYVLDGGTLEVKERYWVSARIAALAFNKAGTRLVMELDDDTVRILDAAGWKEVQKIEKAVMMAPASGADLMAVRGGDWKSHEVRLLSMTDGAEKGKVKFDGRICSFGLNKDATKLVALTEPKDVPKEAEPKVAYGDIPKDLKGLDRTTFEKKNDGRMSTVLIYEMPSGKEVSKKDTWFTTAEDSLVIVGAETTLVVNYDNACGKIAADGAVTLFKTEVGYNYGCGVSADGEKFAGGSLRDGAVVSAKDLTQVTLKLDQLPGFPEYFERFAFGADGTAFGVTSAHRLIKVSSAGKIEKTVPVF